MPLRPWLAAGLALVLAARGGAQAPALELRPGDRIALLGNGLAYGLQQDGWLETLLQARFPDLNLSVRNLGFPADELSVQQRTAGFGTWDDWLARAGADVVLAFFGYDESFAGDAGLPDFRRELGAFVQHVSGRRYGRDVARLVLFSPLVFEDQGARGPDAAATNARLAAYSQALREVARERGVAFVDLFALSRVLSAFGEPLTRDGLHLTDAGAVRVARAIEASLCGAPASWPDEARLQALRALVKAKDQLWFDVYQASDGNNVYGGRSTLVYDGVSNAEVLQRELQRLEVRADNADRRIHAAARAAPEEPEGAEPPPIPVATNRPGPLPGGAFEFLGGEAAINTMTVGDGLAVNLFASEERFPELAKPVQMSFDTRGRLWVATWPSYPHPTPDVPRPDRLLILQDDDGDGVADTCRTFADGLRNPTGFEFWNGGVFLAQAPDLLFLMDTDGDDVADVREVVLSGLSSADTHHTANSFVLGPDGALYFQEGIFHQSQIETVWGPVRNHDACVWRFEPRTGRLERAAAYDFLNPHGHVFDRWGQDIITDGTTNENYVAAPLAGWLPPDAKHAHYFPFFPQRSRPAGGTEILSSRAFPPEFQGNELIANVIGFQGIFRYRLEPDGAGLSGTEEQPILFSSDPNFRPVDLETGPDGALYVLDWQTPLIGHMQHHLRDPNRDHAHGRVYRITPAGAPLEVPAAIAGQPVPALLELLKSPDDRVRYRSRIELSAHDASEVVAETGHWAATLDVNDPDREHHLLEAVWTLQQQGVVDEVLLERVLRSSEPRARAAAVRVVRQMRGQVERPLERLAAAAVDDDPRVRLEAVVALSFFPDAHAAELALGVRRFPMDRFLDYALDETLRALQPQWRAALAAGQPFAQDDPDGLAFALARLDTADLDGVRPSEALWRELLSRPGLPSMRYVGAAAGIAGWRGGSAADQLLEAIRRADARSDAHADHLLSGLFAALGERVDGDPVSLAAALRTLAADGRRASTRRLATAARVRLDGALDPAWTEALGSAGALGDLLDSAPLLDDPALQAELFPRLLPLLDGLPPELAVAAGAATVGRYVRVELPGPARTLTLAEVQVLSRGENVAPRGRASQSSTAWSGVAERALDGNTSGDFADEGQTHTVEDQPYPWWEVDLGLPLPLDSITFWNRTEEDGRFAARLDDWVVRVLDAERRTVFEAGGEHAPSPSLTLDVGGPALRVRRAAVRALGALAAAGVRTDEAVLWLTVRWSDEAVRADVSAALAAIPSERLSDNSVDALAKALDTMFAAYAEERYATDDGRRLLALIDELVPLVERRDPPRAAALRAERRRHGSQVLVVRPVRDSLQYDRRELTVVAGRPVELLFDNVDIMPHNLVVAAPGALARVGLAAEALAARPDASASGWVPDLPEVLHATRLLQPGESQTLAFDAPSALGDYPYVCTFPGHWVRMNGVLHVVAEGDESGGTDDVAAAPGTDAPSRPFVRDWAPEDFAGALAGAAHADPAAGRAVLDAAACLKCHAIDGAGAHTGPDLRDVATRWAGADLLVQVLRPSQVIADGYASELLFLRDGGIVSGRVTGEDDDGLDVLDNPYSATPRRVPRASIEERRPSAVSIMPEGLLSTFSRDEVVELVGYLESLRPAGAGSR